MIRNIYTKHSFNQRTIKIRKTALILFLLFFVLPYGWSQKIFSPNAKFTDTTKIDSLTIWIYTNPVNAPDTTRGTLSIKYSPDHTKDYHFTWGVLNPATKNFDSLTTTYFDSVSTISDLVTGAYNVIIKKDGKDSVIWGDTAWIFIDKLRIKLKKNNEGYVPEGSSLCTHVDPGIYTDNDNVPEFAYYHANMDGAYYIFKINDTAHVKNPVNIEWSITPENNPYKEDSSQFSFKYSTNNIIEEIVVAPPPPYDVTFSYSFKDRFGLEYNDEVKYKTKVPEAIFDIKANLPDYTKEDKGLAYQDFRVGEAPLDVQFINKSINSTRFKFTIDTSKLENGDSLLLDIVNNNPQTDNDPIQYTFTIPRKYKVKMIAYNGINCSYELKKTVTVLDSEIKLKPKSDNGEFPTFFTPNVKGYKGNGYQPVNDHFIFKTDSLVSIKNMHLLIFNQWGKLVYEYNKPFPYNAVCWDGKINGKWANPGIYYYVYKATGYGPFKNEGNKTPSIYKEGRGFFYLLREDD